jgi:hypothetical protein
MKAKDEVKSYWPYPWKPAHRGLIEKLCALAPDRADEWWADLTA